MAEVAAIADELKSSEVRLGEVQAALSDFMLTIPNLPDESVPVGNDETGNVVVRSFGTPPRFFF